MKAYEAVGLAALYQKEALTKIVASNSNGFPGFLNINGIAIPQGDNGIHYLEVTSPGGYILCGGSEQNPNNLNKKNLEFVSQGDYVSIVGGVLAGVSKEYFQLRYPRLANPIDFSSIDKKSGPLTSESLQASPPQGNTPTSSGSNSY